MVVIESGFTGGVPEAAVNFAAGEFNAGFNVALIDIGLKLSLFVGHDLQGFQRRVGILQSGKLALLIDLQGDFIAGHHTQQLFGLFTTFGDGVYVLRRQTETVKNFGQVITTLDRDRLPLWLLVVKFQRL